MTDARQSTRRDFLQAKSAADALVEFASGSGSLVLPEGASGGYLLHLSRRAMACNFEIFLNAGQYAHDTESAVAALDLIDRLEDQLSVYRQHSEISQMNRQAADEDISVEPGLFALLETTARIHTDTAGAYDVTAARLSSAWGFTRRSGTMPTPQILSEALECVGSQYLQFNRAKQSVRFLRSGMEINLGSIGKGYALDRVAELLCGMGLRDFLLHGGNSSVLARGSYGSGGDSTGWSVGVRHPLRPARRLGQLRLNDRALATSGSGTQFFIHDGQRYGHILDPRTGWPAQGVLSVSVLAPTAAEADALSTAFYVMGPDRVNEYCEKHPEIAVVMVCPGQRQGSIEPHMMGMSPADWTELDEA